jgi:ABC-type cobalamin/Fe3+-siderophores transport system ATPase subunit
MILKVAGITFSYNSHAVLSGIDFTLSPGEILAVLGPNGVDKTTLIKCINAIHRPRAGIVCVDKKDVLTLSPMDVARKVGYVAQRNEPLRVTAFDAVLMGRRPHVRWGVTRHDLNTAFRYADQCIFLKDGKIFFAGSPQEVDVGIIEAVYGLPIDIYRQDGQLFVTPKSDRLEVNP